MKKFAFSLQRILGFKKTLYEKERNTLAQLRAERLTLQDRRDSTENQMLALDEEFRHKAATEGVSIDEVNQMNYHRTNADKLVRQLEEEIRLKDVEIEKQLEIVIALDKEVKSLENLREKQWEEYQAETAREEQERILEIVSGRFVSEKAEQASEEQDAGGLAAR